MNTNPEPENYRLPADNRNADIQAKLQVERNVARVGYFVAMNDAVRTIPDNPREAVAILRTLYRQVTVSEVNPLSIDMRQYLVNEIHTKMEAALRKAELQREAAEKVLNVVEDNDVTVKAEIWPEALDQIPELTHLHDETIDALYDASPWAPEPVREILGAYLDEV